MRSIAQANDPRIIFELTDEPSAWFWNTAGLVAGFRPLAVATPGTEYRQVEYPTYTHQSDFPGLTPTTGTASDDTGTGNCGMGGQGLLTIPVVYNG